MEQEMLKQILELVLKIDTRMDKFEARMDKFEARMDKFESRMDKFEARMDKFESRMISMEVQQIEDSKLLRAVFENSIDTTERITGHDHIFDALQSILEKRKQSDDAAF